MKKALGLFSCAGRTFSSLSRRDRCAGSRWEPCLRTSDFGCPLSFVRKRTRCRTPSRRSGLRLLPKAANRGASSKAGRFLESRALPPPLAALALLSTHARSAYLIRGEAGFLRMAVVLTSSISLRFVCCQTFAHFAARPLPTETAPLGFGGGPAFVGCREASSSLVARSGSEISCLTRIPAFGEAS